MASSSPRTPNFFIVGAPKCGTTSMWAYLRQHPDVFMLDRKEMQFFAPELVLDRHRRTLEQYLAMYAGATTQRIVGEASAWHLYSKTSARNIHDFCPSAKILILLRNPIEMIVANHSELLYNGSEDIEDFEAALDAEDDRRHGRRMPRLIRPFIPEILLYRETGKYYEQVRRYLGVFGREQTLILFQEDMKRDTPAIFRQTCEFLGVATDAPIDFAERNPNKVWRSLWLRDLHISPPRALAAMGGVLLPAIVRRKLRSAVWRVGVRERPRQPMPIALRRRLANEFQGDVAKLGELVGRDLSHWTTVTDA